MKTSWKIPIHFNEIDMQELQEVGKGIGIRDINSVHGAVPKIIRFSISFTLNSLKQTSKVIPTLKPDILELYLASIKRQKIEDYLAEKKQKQ